MPDLPGGGTVDWTNPWGQHKFVSNIELREDGGTPSFLQAIRAALAIKLKQEMGIEKMALFIPNEIGWKCAADINFSDKQLTERIVPHLLQHQCLRG